MTVLQVPAGEEGGPGELLNMKKEEKEEEIKGNRSCCSCANDFPAKKKVNNHIVEMQKDPTSC